MLLRDVHQLLEKSKASEGLGGGVKYCIANWKMNGDKTLLAKWAQAMAPLISDEDDVECILCPPATLLDAAAHELRKGMVGLGAQNCHTEESGAFTGELSAKMLQEMGCEYVIIGHSDRRTQAGETDEQVAAKCLAAWKLEMTPIICVGETQEEREKGETLAVLERQIKRGIPTPAGGVYVLAYEPVWAIGSGRTPTFEEIQHVHRYLKKIAPTHEEMDDSTAPVVYGGSVNPANIQPLLATEGVSGVLVGGASLKPDEFAQIVRAVVKV